MTSKKNQRSSLISSSLKMAGATFTSRILGLVREQVIAAYFGASFVTDAFNVAYRIPNILRDLFAEGAFSSAFVPIFTQVNVKDPERAKKIFWSMAVILFMLTGLCSLFISLFAENLVLLITDERFSADPKTLELTISMVRIMSPFLVLISLAALFMGVLNSLKIFFIPSLAPAFYNVLMIGSILFLPDVIEAQGFHPIFALAIGVVLGGLGQMLIQLPLIFMKGYGPKKPEFGAKENKSVLNRLGIGTIGIAATQINIFVTTILATSTVAGAVSWLGYAFRLFQFPVGILSVSIAGSNLVHFSEAWKQGESEKAKSYLKESYFWSWMLVLPALGLMFLQAEVIVKLIFERGEFLRSDTLETANVLKAYLLGLPFYGLYKVFAPTFFTLDKPKLPVFISSFCVLLNVIFCAFLVPHFGHFILALGTSVSIALNCLLQSYFLNRELKLGFSFFFSQKLLKLILAFLVLVASCYVMQSMIEPFEFSFLKLALSFALTSLISSLLYFLALYAMNERTFLSFLKR